MACEVRSWGFSPAEMERSSGFRVGFFPDEEWGGVLVVVAVVVVKDLEMRIFGDWKSRRVGVVVVVVVLSSILMVLFFFPQVTKNDERRTTNDLCLLSCLPLGDYSSQETDFE